MKTHAVMFHHFHNQIHPKGQGSLSEGDLEKMLAWLQQEYRVLCADEYLDKALRWQLREDETCLTLDDSLLCQYEIANSVIEAKGLTAFYFVYSSAFTETPDPLEIYRYFRSTKFADFDEFFENFMLQALYEFPKILKTRLSDFNPDKYLTAFPFYTREDRIFRYLRDEVWAPHEYEKVMKSLMWAKGFSASDAQQKIYMQPSHLTELHSKGHIIGLHSHSHPTRLDLLSPQKQKEEYQQNLSFLDRVIGQPIRTMSHPCGRYTEDTLEILTQLEISIGFRSSRSVEEARTLLEIPREDHANVVTRMKL